MTSIAIKLTSPEAIRAACELSTAQGEQLVQVMYKSDDFEDDDYVGADLEEFASVKEDTDEFAEFCGGRRHSWELWVYEVTLPANEADAGSIAIVWNVEDVLEVRPDLTEEQAKEVLRRVKHGHDANFGINWEVLTTVAGDLFPEVATTSNGGEVA
jgi:hypothetical protein